MTRRPDWHPSYGDTPPLRTPTLAERTAAMRDRMGIPHPRPNYRMRAVTGVIAACSSLFFLDGSLLAAISLDAFAVWVLWPCLRDADDILG